MSHLVALETKLGIALKRVMGPLATQNAVRATSLVRTLLGHMSEQFAVATFNRWI